MHQVQGLCWTPGVDAAQCQTLNRAFTHPRIGIDNNHHVRCIAGQVTHPEVQCITLASLLSIAAFHHLGTRGAGQRGRVVRTVVRDNHQAIARQQLRQNAVQRRDDQRGLVVSRHQHRHPRSRSLRRCKRSHRQAGQQHLHEQHPHRQDDEYQQCTEQPTQ
ncbi:hypothetical protein D3C84_664920 [compost metagenome]